MTEPIRVALIGAGRRATNVYAPLLKALRDDVQLVSIWSRSQESGQKLAAALGVPSFTSLDDLLRATAPQIGVVSVSSKANDEVGLMAVEAGLHVLLETPIAHKLGQADAIIRAREQRRLKIEVAEQYHYFPMEQIKLKLIEAGVFGRVYASFNDFAGQNYHGMSMLRSYLGFETRPVQISGAVREYELTPHRARWGGAFTTRASETQEHGLIDFEGGRLGVFHWTDIANGSPLRWWRSSRFLAQKGMAITTGGKLNVEEQLSILTPDTASPQLITVDRRSDPATGALAALIAHTGDPAAPLATWDNPLRSVAREGGAPWSDNEIGVAGCLLSLVDALRTNTAPAYGPHQGRLDQEMILALHRSSAAGGRPISLPLAPTGIED